MEVSQVGPAERDQSPRIAPAAGWSSRRTKSERIGICAIWGNAEDRRRDKQGEGVIYFRWPKGEQGRSEAIGFTSGWWYLG